jgi:hypothetical protein
MQVLNDRTNNLIEEKPRHSEDDILNYINTSLFPKLKNKLKIYWNCFQ